MSLEKNIKGEEDSYLRFGLFGTKVKVEANDQIARVVKIWLCIGLFMVFMQVVIGGVTRLTGSGLSITKWDVVTGTIPPMSESAWKAEFELYKATPQYEMINDGMEMGSIFQGGTFKFIYFWEYLHRLWARTMGFVFAIPFFIFLARGMLSKSLIKDLGIVILLAVLVASMGWIMVASGLINRPWVNGYKLSMHLSLAFILAGYLLWTTFKVIQPSPKVIHKLMLKRLMIGFIVILGAQIFLGGLMSGMRAGLQYPTWPDMNGKVVPEVVLNSSNWNVDNLVNYDSHGFTPALIQVLHRLSAYLLILLGFFYFFKAKKVFENSVFNKANMLWITMLVIQILLGIWTVISCKGSIPVGLGVAHQACALILLGTTLFVYYQLRQKRL